MNDEISREVAGPPLSEPLGADEIRQKSQQQIKAREAIIQSIERWTGYRPDDEGRLPLIRDGEFFGYEPRMSANYLSRMGGDRISRVTLGVWAEDRTTLSSRLEQYRKLEKSIKDTMDSIVSMTIMDRGHLEDGRYPSGAEINERIIFSIGYIASIEATMPRLLNRLHKAIEFTESQRQSLGLTVGRPKKEARYNVAKEFALLYLHITGEVPTFCKGIDGYSGKFTPELDRLFRAIGWHNADLSGPAQNACAAAREAALSQEKTQATSGLLGLMTALPNQ